MHQSCRLKRVVHTFTPEIVSGQTSQFIVHADEEFIGRRRVTFRVGFGWFADLSFRGHIPLQLVEWSWTCLGETGQILTEAPTKRNLVSGLARASFSV